MGPGRAGMAPTSGPGWVRNAGKQSTGRIWTGPLRTRDGTWTGPGPDPGEGLDGTPRDSNRLLGLSESGCEEIEATLRELGVAIPARDGAVQIAQATACQHAWEPTSSWERKGPPYFGGSAFSMKHPQDSGPEKGVTTKGVFSLEKSLESLNSPESLEKGRNLLSFPQSEGSLETLESLNSLENGLF